MGAISIPRGFRKGSSEKGKLFHTDLDNRSLGNLGLVLSSETYRFHDSGTAVLGVRNKP